MADNEENLDWVAEVDRDQLPRLFTKYNINTPERRSVAVENMDRWMDSLVDLESAGSGNVMNVSGDSKASGYTQVIPSTKDLIVSQMSQSKSPAVRALGKKVASAKYFMDLPKDEQLAASRFHIYQKKGSDPYINRVFDGDPGFDLYERFWHTVPTKRLRKRGLQFLKPGKKMPTYTRGGSPLLRVGQVGVPMIVDKLAGGGPVADPRGIAALGRGRDTELVHMTPSEVGGLQQLAESLGGSLTINPNTGLPEAGFLEDWGPTILGLALAPMTGGLTLGTQMGIAAATGATAGAVTGDWKQGLRWGMGVAGGQSMGSSLMGAGAPAATGTAAGGQTASQTASQTAGQTAGQTASQAARSVIPTGASGTPMYATGDIAKRFGTDVLGQGYSQMFKGITAKDMAGIKALGMKAPLAAFGSIALNPYTQELEPLDEKRKKVEGEMEYPEGGFRAPTRTFATSLGPSDSREELMFQPNPFVGIGYEPYYGAGGGIVDIEEYQEGGAVNTQTTPAAPAPLYKESFPSYEGSSSMYTPSFPSYETSGGISSLGTGEKDYFPGETRQEKAEDAAHDFKTQMLINNPETWLSQYSPWTGLPIIRQHTPGMEMVTDPRTGRLKYTYPEVDVSPVAPAQTSFSSSRIRPMAPAGTPFTSLETYASPSVRTDFNPTDKDIGMALMAGIASQGGKYTPPASFTATNPFFRRAQGFGSGEARYFNEGGLTKGPGDGMSDEIMTTISGVKPAALSPGEFVVPADVVSGVGNGDTNAGAKRLYAMMDRVRKSRTGKTSQPKEIDAGGMLPA
jgi:hypothetical protein